MIGKTAMCLRLRGEAANCIMTSGNGPQISVEEIRALLPVLENLFKDKKMNFPVDLSKYSAAKAEIEAKIEFENSAGMVKDISADGVAAMDAPTPVAFSGTQIAITVEKIGLKDAKENYMNPYCRITVAGAGSGRCPDGEVPQDTSYAVRRDPQYLVFDQTITLRTPLEHLEQIPGVAIFIELQHFKAKSDKVSTKCYSFMELDELVDGPVVLEILKCEKPTDFQRKGKPKRLSVKDLHMHVSVQLTQK